MFEFFVEIASMFYDPCDDKITREIKLESKADSLAKKYLGATDSNIEAELARLKNG